jgi:peptidyl-prolyl cis-trans isomerase D
MAVKGAKGKSGQIIVYGLLALLILGLGGFGVSNFGGGIVEVGSVGETKIGVDEYARALQQETQRLSQQTGQQLTVAEARAIGLDRMVLQRLVGQAALDDEARRIGLSVGDGQVAEEIRQIPAFQGVDGQFDREGYEFTLERNGMTPARFEEEVRAEVSRGLLQASVAGGVRVPVMYLDTLWAYAREGRDVTWARLTPGGLEAAIPEPTEADLADYHDAHPESFTAPEARVVTYAWITPEMLAGEIESDEEMLRRLYDERADEYLQPERRLVERLVLGTEAEAQAAADRIAAGETTFDALVEERGLTLADVDIGDVSRDELGDAAEAVFAVEVPGVSGPAPSNLGPALYRVNAALAAQETTFEEARDDLAAEVEADQARRVIDDMEQDVEDLLAGGATLEETADETELELGTVTLEDGTADGPVAYEAFREAAMAAAEGDYPELAPLDDGGIFALRLDEVRQPEVRPLAEVREAVAREWRAARIREALLERAEAVAAAVAGGASFEDQGLESGTATDIERDGFVEGLPAEAVAEIFEMAPGEARAVSTDTGAAVIRLDRVLPADQDSPQATAAKAAFGGQSAAGLSDDILEAFVRATQADAGISLDQSALDAVHTQLP